MGQSPPFLWGATRAAVALVLVLVWGPIGAQPSRPVASPVSLPEDLAPLAARSAAAVVPLPHHAWPHGVIVDDDGVQCPDPDFTTIQDAVDTGAQTIRICAGTYPENVVVPPGSNLTLYGDGQGQTIVTGVAGTPGPIIDVGAGSHVTVKHLTVDGQSALSGLVVYGIRYVEAGGSIFKVEVLNVRDASGDAQGIGIRVESSSGAPARVKVAWSRVDNYTRGGVNGNGSGVELEVFKSVVTGPLPPKVWAPNGIQVSRGATGAVSYNQVDNNPSPNLPGGGGSGIILFCAGPTSVFGNHVTEADFGIALGDNANGRVFGNSITNSTSDAISLQFIGDLFGPLGCTPTISPTEHNLVTFNLAVNSGATGISFANFDLPSGPATPNDNRVLLNRVDGAHVFDGTGNEISRNRLQRPGTDAVDDTTGGGTAGTANTWKQNQCATSSPPGLCQ